MRHSGVHGHARVPLHNALHEGRLEVGLGILVWSGVIWRDDWVSPIAEDVRADGIIDETYNRFRDVYGGGGGGDYGGGVDKNR